MEHDQYKVNVERTLHNLKRRKRSKVPSIISTTLPSGKTMHMFVITDKHSQDNAVIRRLAQWRKKSNVWFPSQFVVTHEGTKRWAKAQLLEIPDRILFFLQVNENASPFGHVGLYRFNYMEKSCEIDNVIRGKNEVGTQGAMTHAVKLLCDWAIQYLGIQTFYLRVFSDNKKAISIYERVGFREVGRKPLIKNVENDIVNWEEAKAVDMHETVHRFFVKMKLELS